MIFVWHDLQLQTSDQTRIASTSCLKYILHIQYGRRVTRVNIRPLSCGFDSSVGRALHRHCRGRGFESRSEPENFFRSLFKQCYGRTCINDRYYCNRVLSFHHYYYCTFYLMISVNVGQLCCSTTKLSTIWYCMWIIFGEYTTCHQVMIRWHAVDL